MRFHTYKYTGSQWEMSTEKNTQNYWYLSGTIPFLMFLNCANTVVIPPFYSGNESDNCTAAPWNPGHLQLYPVTKEHSNFKPITHRYHLCLLPSLHSHHFYSEFQVAGCFSKVCMWCRNGRERQGEEERRPVYSSGGLGLTAVRESLSRPFVNRKSSFWFGLYFLAQFGERVQNLGVCVWNFTSWHLP